MYYGRSIQVADVDFDTNHVEEAITEAARNAAEGFGPYNDIERTAESIYLAVEGRVRELESTRDDLDAEISDLEDLIVELRAKRDELNDEIDDVEGFDEFDVKRIVRAEFAAYAEETAEEEEEEEDDGEDAA